MNNNKFKTAKDIRKDDNLEVLLTLKRNIFKNLKVASLGQVTKIGSDIINVTLFPLYKEETNVVIDCYKLKDLELKPNDVVLILFLDRNFIQNLKQIKNNQSKTNLDVNNVELHSLKYGIIIGIL